MQNSLKLRKFWPLFFTKNKWAWKTREKKDKSYPMKEEERERERGGRWTLNKHHR